MTEELKRRVDERVEKMMREYDKEAQRVGELEKAVKDFPQIVMYTCEFLCVFMGILMTVVGNPASGACALLTGIYLRMWRKP